MNLYHAFMRTNMIEKMALYANDVKKLIIGKEECFAVMKKSAGRQRQRQDERAAGDGF